MTSSHALSSLAARCTEWQPVDTGARDRAAEGRRQPSDEEIEAAQRVLDRARKRKRKTP